MSDMDLLETVALRSELERCIDEEGIVNVTRAKDFLRKYRKGINRQFHPNGSEPDTIHLEFIQELNQSIDSLLKLPDEQLQDQIISYVQGDEALLEQALEQLNIYENRVKELEAELAETKNKLAQYAAKTNSKQKGEDPADSVYSEGFFHRILEPPNLVVSGVGICLMAAVLGVAYFGVKESLSSSTNSEPRRYSSLKEYKDKTSYLRELARKCPSIATIDFKGGNDFNYIGELRDGSKYEADYSQMYLLDGSNYRISQGFRCITPNESGYEAALDDRVYHLNKQGRIVN